MSKTRLEQRHVEDHHEISVRIRQFAKLSIPVPFVPKESQLEVFFADEVIMNLNSTEIKGDFGAIENRINVGVSKRFTLMNSPACFSISYLHRTDFNKMNHHAVSVGLIINPQWGLNKKKAPKAF